MQLAAVPRLLAMADRSRSPSAHRVHGSIAEELMTPPTWVLDRHTGLRIRIPTTPDQNKAAADKKDVDQKKAAGACVEQDAEAEEVMAFAKAKEGAEGGGGSNVESCGVEESQRVEEPGTP